MEALDQIELIRINDGAAATAASIDVNIPLLDESKSRIECPVCISTQADFTLTCGHQFCSNCLINYVSTNVSSRKFNMQCPQTGCENSLMLEDINKFAPSFVAQIRTEIYKDHGRAKKCCNNCKTPLIVPLDMVKKQMFNVLQCPNQECSSKRSYICFYCNLTVSRTALRYGMHVCFERDGRMLKKSVKIGEKWVTRHCPNCYMIIVKNGGCPNMHCTTCNQGFCWNCLGAQNHPNTAGVCPGYTAQLISKRKIEKFAKNALLVTASPVILAGAVAVSPIYVGVKAYGKANEMWKVHQEKVREERFQRLISMMHKIDQNVQLVYSFDEANLAGMDDAIREWVGKDAQPTYNSTVTKTVLRNTRIQLRLVRTSLDVEGDMILLPPQLQPNQQGWKKLTIDQLLDTYAIVFQEALFYVMSTYPENATKRQITEIFTGPSRKEIYTLAQKYLSTRYPTVQEQLALSTLPWNEICDDFRQQVRKRIGVLMKL